MIEAFLRDVRKLHAADPFDLVILSGDVAFSGSRSEFELASEMFLDPLLGIVELDSDRLIIVPGNHDVDVSRIDPYAEEGLSKQLVDREAVDGFLASTFAPAHLARLENFDTFHSNVSRLDNDVVLEPRGRVRTFDEMGGGVAVAALDSAWRASGGPNDIDKGRILVGERQIRAAAAAVDAFDLRVAVVHHPLDWFVGFDQDACRLQLERHFDLVLLGHIHRADPVEVVSTRGSCIYLQGGALYQGRDEVNTYSVVSINDTEVRVEIRAYLPGRDEFDRATSIAADGAFVLPRSGRVSEGGQGQPIVALESVAYSEIVGSLVAQAQTTSVIADRMADVHARSLDDLLVPPDFLPVPYAQAIAPVVEQRDGGISEVDVRGLLEAGTNVLITADREAGLTNALWWLLEKNFAGDASRFPVYVHFSELASGKAMKRIVRDKLMQNGVRTPAERLPPLLIAIDDVDGSKTKSFGAVIKFASEQTDAVFVFGTKDETQRETTQGFKDAEVNLERAFLGPFGRRHLRRLLGKVATDVVPQIDTILQCVVSENLPRTPFVMAALVAVMSAGAGFNESLSETALLERYTSLLLNRWGAPEDPKVDLDYRSREHILSEFAAELTRQGEMAMTRLEAERFLVDYFEKRGWQGSAGHVLDDLTERRVLMQSGDTVSFRHVALQELFVAKQMIDQPEFASFVLADPLSESSAIKHAAALKRNDEELLLEISKFGRGLLAEWVARTEPALFTSPEGALDTGEAEDELIDHRLEYEPPSEEHKDELWDEFEAEHHNQTLDEEQELTASQESFLGLRLWSLVLRHSELVPHVPLKAELLKEQLVAWARFGDAWYAQEIETGPIRDWVLELRDSATDKPLEPRDDDDQRVEVMIRLIIGSTLGMWAVEALGTKKLANPLAEVLEEPDFRSDVAASFLGTILYAHVEGKGWPQRLRTLVEEHGDHYAIRAISRSIAVYLYNMSTSLNMDDRKVIEGLVADIMLKDRPLPSGTSVPKVAAERNRYITKLKEARLRVQHSKKSAVVEPYLTRDVTDPYDEHPVEGT